MNNTAGQLFVSTLTRQAKNIWTISAMIAYQAQVSYTNRSEQGWVLTVIAGSMHTKRSLSPSYA